MSVDWVEVCLARSSSLRRGKLHVHVGFKEWVMISWLEVKRPERQSNREYSDELLVI